MHFIKKTQVNEDEKNLYERKRATKLKRFIEMRDRIFEKRTNGEYDEEILELTAELLSKHADIYTFWNVRREAIEQLCKKLDDETDEENIERKSKLLDKEMKLTEECLMSNPKSYSSWHHRFLIVRQHPKINFKEELALCDKALTLDCRNFHCWDHRRSVAKLAKLSDVDELSVSNQLIGKNPSNYSAWHYRGTLLPKLEENRQQLGEGRLLTDECLKGEFEKVLHVCGVNSEDQTAWTYCLPNSPEVISVKFLNSTTVFVVFSEAVNKQMIKNIFYQITSTVKFDSVSPFKTSDYVEEFKYLRIWVLSNISDPLEISLNIREENNIEEKKIEIGKDYFNKNYFLKNFTSSPITLRELPRQCLNDLVKLCNDLLPVEDNPVSLFMKLYKWALAALNRVMFALNGIGEQSLELAKSNWEKLKKIDSQRSEMYEELMDKYRLIKFLNEESFSDKEKKLILKEIGLKSIALLSAFISSDCENKYGIAFIAPKNLTLD
ncbi:hypothetical protein Mgra_00001997 [Meloidogyne graminicola]|uniref:Geranylgeranyl transferase type-2 subunit alpha n=1 Tax=Meloidogyne graminicola TaxID=189291 RepID=A0A8S9ZZT1_9BILA|nr:hypothetical protein Mgra_00001997 [Meloidogyne graminicola]